MCAALAQQPQSEGDFQRRSSPLPRYLLHFRARASVPAMPISSVSKMSQNNMLHSKTEPREQKVRVLLLLLDRRSAACC